MDFDRRDTFWKKLKCLLFHRGFRIHFSLTQQTVEECYDECYRKTTFWTRTRR